MDGERGLSRRELVKLGLASGMAAGWLRRAEAGDTTAKKPSAADGARNIIFMISDGMSMAVPSLAEHFARHVRGRGTAWYELMQRDDAVHGFFETCPLGNLVTDSSAASSAWGTGSKVCNGAVNVLPDGRELTPIAPLAQDARRRVGLVTTTRLTDGTPAGFAAVQANRRDEHLTAPQYLDVVDVLLGGGGKHFRAGQREDGRDLIGEFGARGYALWTDREDVLKAPRPARVLGLFADSHLPYTLDQRNDTELSAGVPTLEEMTRAALAILSASPDGFLLQVEGARIDHAAHANDMAALLWDQLAFDDAIAAALAFAAEQRDTLVVITSDHGCANPGLNGTGRGYRDSARFFERLALAKCSSERLIPRLQAAQASVDDVWNVLRSDTGLEVTRADAEAVQSTLSGQRPAELFAQHANLVGVLGQILGNHTGVGWTGVCHTEDPMIVTAYGAGAERFAGLASNTAAFGHMAALFDIRHHNPQMTADEARPYLALAPAPMDLHWL